MKVSLANWSPRSRLFFASIIVAIILPVFLVVPPVAPGNALWWDFLMALGYVATGLLFLLPLLTTRFWFLVRGDASEANSMLLAHRMVTYLACLFLIVHVVGLLILDTLVIEYLKASAPWGMVAALLATSVICVSIVQSEFRIKLKMGYKSWRVWHMILSAVAVIGTFYHIFEARYFVQSASEIFALSVLSATVGIVIFISKREYRPSMAPPSGRFTTGKTLLRFTILASVVATLFAFVFSIPIEGNRTERQTLHCLLENC